MSYMHKVNAGKWDLVLQLLVCCSVPKFCYLRNNFDTLRCFCATNVLLVTQISISCNIAEYFFLLILVLPAGGPIYP